VNVFASPDDPTTSASAAVVEPRFPKSLYLIGPLFLSYELNPVAPHAHESVPVPEGLDLDAWIVPPTPPPPDPLEKKARKSRKGKGKEVNGSVGEKTGKKKRREEVVPDVVVEPEETVEEREERERVSAFSFLPIVNASFGCANHPFFFFPFPLLTLG
jgi:AP-3 complex subunit delta-1